MEKGEAISKPSMSESFDILHEGGQPLNTEDLALSHSVSYLLSRLKADIDSLADFVHPEVGDNSNCASGESYVSLGVGCLDIKDLDPAAEFLFKAAESLVGSHISPTEDGTPFPTYSGRNTDNLPLINYSSGDRSRRKPILYWRKFPTLETLDSPMGNMSQKGPRVFYLRMRLIFSQTWSAAGQFKSDWNGGLLKSQFPLGRSLMNGQVSETLTREFRQELQAVVNTRELLKNPSRLE